MNKDEATRIAGAVHALRPDWHPNGLMAVLGDDRLRYMAYADIAPVFVALALDVDSRKPTRIHEAGLWWQAARTIKPEHNTSAHIRRPAPIDCDVCGKTRDLHTPGRIEDHTYRPRHASGHGTPMTNEARTRLAEVAEQRPDQHDDMHDDTTTERTTS